MNSPIEYENPSLLPVSFNGSFVNWSLLALEQTLEEHLCQENKQTANTGKKICTWLLYTHVFRERLPE